MLCPLFGAGAGPKLIDEVSKVDLWVMIDKIKMLRLVLKLVIIMTMKLGR
ncbi:hypothetical protein [Borrelia hermsii]|nr:hypothetical protein [Borrelia hermsii]